MGQLLLSPREIEQRRNRKLAAAEMAYKRAISTGASSETADAAAQYAAQVAT